MPWADANSKEDSEKEQSSMQAWPRLCALLSSFLSLLVGAEQKILHCPEHAVVVT